MTSIRRKRLTILVLGLAGSGKSELVDNLLGEEKKTESGVTNGRCVSGKINQRTVKLYDSPGLGGVSVSSDDAYLAEMGDWIPKVDATICCLKMNETTIDEGMIQMFDELNKMGLEWRKVLFALTFADAISAPSSKRNAPGFDPALYFDNRFKEWKREIANLLTSKVGPNVGQLSICPTTDDLESALPNGKMWINSFTMTLLEVADRTLPEYHDVQESPAPAGQVETHNDPCPCSLL